MEAKNITSRSEHIYFGLWADDIGKYLSTGYNATSIKELRSSLLNYISVDNDNPEGSSDATVFQILNMTGLSLDYKCEEFPYKKDNDVEPIALRVGKKVHKAFIS